MFNSAEGFGLTSLTLTGLSGAALLLCCVGAHAESAASRSGGTIYPAPASSVASPATPGAAVAAATPASETKSSGRRQRWASRRERRVAAAAPTSVETTPAPTPAAQTTAPISPAPTDGPHETAAPTLRDLVSKHARENGVPEGLATAVVRLESQFNPNARGRGALGLMQIKYQTARSVGFSGNASGLLQPDTNLHYGMKVLADAYKASNGNVCMTLARYQSGQRTMRMTAANRDYCNRARAYMAKL